MRVAPQVSEAQAKVLRLARDGGHVLSVECHPGTFRSCCHHRWLAPRTVGYIITDAGLAALAHFDEDVKQEKLWEGRRG